MRLYYRRGFGRMFIQDDQFAEMTKPRLFQFNEDSKYSALSKGSEQWEAIEQYEEHKQIPVYYLFYNPFSLPCAVAVPHVEKAKLPKDCVAGCRVVPCRHVRKMMVRSKANESPTYGQLTKKTCKAV